MLWDGIDPVLRHRVRLDLLLVLVVLERDVELEALGLVEACLHDSVAAHLQNVHLDQLSLFSFFIKFKDRLVKIWDATHSLMVSLEQGFTCALLDFVHGEADLFLALLDR